MKRLRRPRTSARLPIVQACNFEPLESRQLMSATIPAIMPMGDSITKGITPTDSYRFWLWNKLADAGYIFDFVGGVSGVEAGPSTHQGYDQQHEGYNGLHADGMVPFTNLIANRNVPDIVLLQFGTNDVFAGESNSSTIAEIGQIIDDFRVVNPNVKILLANVIPNTAHATETANLNTLFPALVSSKNTAQSPVVLVDQASGFDVNNDTYDGIHPDESGEQKYANKWYDALVPFMPAPTTPPEGVYLDQLTPDSSSNGWGPVEFNTSNGETDALDGRLITIGGTSYVRGLGIASPSEISYDLTGDNYTRFRATIGVDDEVGNLGSVVFQVFVNDEVLPRYSSPTLTGSGGSVDIDIDVTNGTSLRLVVLDAGDGFDFDHADWALARLIVQDTPDAPSSLSADYNSGTGKVDLGWNDESTNETGFRVERRDGLGGLWSQIADLPAGSEAFSDPNVLIGKTYYYRVYAYNGAGNSQATSEDNASIPLPATAVFLSDRNYVVVSNAWGPAEKDRSNGEQGATDGNPLRLNGVQYAKGIGTHAGSEITFSLNGNYTHFVSDIGIDDEAGSNGSVIFQVFFDGSGTPAYQSPVLTGTSATETISLNVTGKTTMRLVVNPNGVNTWDHADWANARLVPTAAAIAPNAPSNLEAVLNGNQVDLDWIDASSDETGFRVERKAGAGGAWGQIADLGVNSTEYTDSSSLAAGTVYFYRVYAYKPAVNSTFSNEDSITTPIPPGTTYLSDLTPTSSSNAWGPFENDRSNGEQGAADGKTITLNGTTYLKGLGTHAASQITYALNGLYTQFLSDIGIDDEAGSNGSVIFQVFLDSDPTPAYQSPLMTGTSTTISIPPVNVTGRNTLRLVVTNGNGNNTWDHADWANARLVAGALVPAPNAPSVLDAALNGNQIDISWIDNSGDETGFRLQRKVGTGVWQQIADLGVNVTSFSDTTVSTGFSYSYRVLAYNAGGDSTLSNEDSATVPVPPGTTYVSDLTPTTSSNGWGPFEKDKSNGEQPAGDGKTLTLNGVTYAKGLGFHAGASITYNLNGLYTQFLSDIGIDDEAGSNGSVIFQVFLDGSASPIYQSPVMTGTSATISIPAIDVTGVNTLRLAITDGGNGNIWDHADWADARLISGPAVPPPAAPSGLDAVLNGNQVDLTWVDNAGDETAYRVQRKTGAGGVWQQLGADLPADTQAFSDTTVSTGVTYYYRVIVVKGSFTAASNEDDVTVPVPPGTVYLSDLTPTTVSNAWGQYEKDKSNGEQIAGDGKTITLNGVTYAKGLGFHAGASITYALNGQYTQFLSDIGVDDETGANGSVIFQVFLDTDVVPIYQSPLLTGNSSTISIPAINVTGKQSLRLVITDGGNGNIWDHADWANARLIAGPVVPPPDAPTDLTAQLSGANVNLNWIDHAGDETGYRVYRKAANESLWSTIATLGADATSYTDTGPLQPSMNYTYRVVAFNASSESAPSNEPSVVTGAPAFQFFLSSLAPTSQTNGWGPMEQNRSNGETGATDGKTITLNGVTYAQGLGVHANSDITYNLNGQFKTFITDIGVDDEVGSGGSVVFQVYLDGVLAYDSGLMTGASATKSISLNTIGVTNLRLVVTNGGNGFTADHADWAGAKVLA